MKKAPVSRAGRPRSEESRAAILRATNELLNEVGFSGLSIERIAARAGVGKSTIYRWWAGEGPLAIEAFLSALVPKAPFTHSKSAIEDLKTQVPLLARAYKGKMGKVLREIIAIGQTDDETRKLLVSGYLNPRRSEVKEILQRGIEQGELRKDLDLDVVVDAIYGPLFHRLLSGHAPLNERFALTIVETVLQGFAANRG